MQVQYMQFQYKQFQYMQVRYRQVHYMDNEVDKKGATVSDPKRRDIVLNYQK